MEQRRAIALAEAAALAGTSIDTIRRKLRKGELRRANTNKRGLFIDMESLREAFELPASIGQAENAPEKAAAEASLREMVRALEGQLAEMRLQVAESELKRQGEVAELETKLAVSTTLAEQRQAEIERLHELLKVSAVQVPGIRETLRRWLARRLAA
jgi:hypothetical protein